ncbi:MAG: YicC family protein [Bacteroidetes bacterium HGW-Bacteroidetes-14]|nr:MAG: YicC family protein [Bacteroidetes bacterium HGW-Bacteroidetes-14]
MLQSMTGYGKAECTTEIGKITVEIRSVNGKSADINLKTQLIPREYEHEVRQMLSKILVRGSIDLFATLESNREATGKNINRELFTAYYNQIRSINQSLPVPLSEADLLSSILRMPDVIDNQKSSPDVDIWGTLKECIIEAANSMNNFRKTEGEKLGDELKNRVSMILENLTLAEQFDAERSELVRTRLMSKLEDVKGAVDLNRFEQEIIYYLEKLDITEEKVRLRQHCSYFIETLENEEFPGKKLAFIAQEMGREINTLGSKANHAEMQRKVVMMKDDLEKIKEQSLNIL